ncbi:ROK family transcriptional regulator [Lentzea tibetensis]|uniref:ROK family transcriptional regulator n=1 Tax=Lentzea tibetensis TaxID=2591470 RepID=A0A563EWJ4_9PSEU|nr:ROK family transcriptional regulator [Lentzea tibetensis]TWP52076.1 ROK family transcriptional regulator [Lentzea tibetensis]
MSRTASTVLRSVLDHGPVARSTIARLTGLSAATVTKQYAELARRGLVREVDTRIPRVTLGRPHVPVDIDVDRHVVCGVHIAYGHTTFALMNLRGTVLAQEREPHRTTAPEAVLTRIADRVPAFLKENDRTPVGIGLATGGRIDPDSGTIVEHSQLGWRHVGAKRFLGERLGLPVHVDSHSRALARAEQLFGDERTRVSVVHLFVGNVVDAAIATNGTVHSGPGARAGEIAHLALQDDNTPCPCGRTGCLQAAVADRTIAERAVAAGIIDVPDVRRLLDKARHDPRARAVFRQRARKISQAAKLLLDVINPEVLVIVEAGAMHLPECLDEIRARTGDRIVTTSFGSDVLSVAAGSVMLNEVYGHPLYFLKSQN